MSELLTKALALVLEAKAFNLTLRPAASYTEEEQDFVRMLEASDSPNTKEIT